MEDVTIDAILLNRMYLLLTPLAPPFYIFFIIKLQTGTQPMQFGSGGCNKQCRFAK
jgi:hypothetical protein